MNKKELPSIHNFNLDIDINLLQQATTNLMGKFVDVRTANPGLCMNHEELVQDVYDNFEQINLTTPSEVLPHTASIKERLRRREEHLYNVPTADYVDSYFQEIINQLESPASRIRITKLAPGKNIPFHVDYDVNYAVRCIVPIYGDNQVINLFKREGKLEAYNLENGNAYFLNIGFPHAVVNMSNNPRIALMFSLDGTQDIKNVLL
jgi:hypothetical protein